MYKRTSVNDLLHPIQYAYLFLGGVTHGILASLLTYGSSHLQPSQYFTSGVLKIFPIYSGRTVQDFHLFPFSSLQ